MEGIKERLTQFISSLGISVAEFERNCRLSNGFVKNVTSRTRASSLDRIVNIYPQFNVDWIRTGRGEEILSDNDCNIQKADELTINELVKAISNLSEAAIVNANAAMKNAEANDRYSKNMERMLHMISENSIPSKQKRLYAPIA